MLANSASWKTDKVCETVHGVFLERKDLYKFGDQSALKSDLARNLEASLGETASLMLMPSALRGRVQQNRPDVSR